MTTDVTDVADWMLQRVLEERILYQDVAVSEIAARFGDSFAGVNVNGNLSISPKVLTAFRNCSAENVVWERGERAWRIREDYDTKNRGQD